MNANRQKIRLSGLGPIIIFACLILISAFAFARPPRGGGHGPGGPGGQMRGERPDGDFEGFLRRLDLSEEQKNEIKKVLDADWEHRQDLLDARIDAQKVLETAIHKSQPDPAAVRAASAGASEAELQLHLNRARLWSEIFQVLTEDQKQQFSDRSACAREKICERRSEAGEKVRRMARNRLLRVLQQLDLSAGQREEARDVFENRKERLEALARADRAAHETLRQAVFQPVYSPEAIRQASLEHARTHEAIALQRVETYGAVRNLLDEQQRSRLDRLISRGRP